MLLSIMECIWESIHRFLIHSKHSEHSLELLLSFKLVWSPNVITSQERPKSAPYLRLKNSKRTSKCQSILFYGTGKTQKLNRIGAPEGTL